MKVLFILQLYPPHHGASTAGQYIKDSQLVNEQFDCTFIRISTIPVKGSRSPKFLNLFRLYFRVLFTLLNNKYDVVYISPTAAGYKFYKDFGICVLAKFFNNKVVYHFHNKGISVNKFVPKFIMRQFFRNVKVVLSSPLLKYDVEEYVSNDNIIYCPYGIPKDKFLFEKSKTESCVLLFFAHMLVEKGVFDVLEACKILKDKGIDYICNFVGGWYDVGEDEFKEFVQSNELSSKVKYLGPQYGSDKDRILTNTDIFVFPTFYADECFPLGLLEALKFGLPIITTSEGAIAEIIDDGVNGFLLPKNSPQKIAERVIELIENPQRRITLGNNASYKFTKEYTLEQYEKRIVEIVNSL
jgi:glycosyltransferase involved in cell wall biosynthesis